MPTPAARNTPNKVAPMKRNRMAITYSETLLEYVPLCYNVAMALTKDCERARDLTLETIVCVWQERADDATTRGIKTVLLTALRNRYVRDRDASSAAFDRSYAAVASTG